MRKDNTIIKLDNVSLTLPGPDKNSIHILHNITAEVKKGDTVSIVGPSGSGKTSLMMLIAGVEKATHGRIIIEGEDITNLNEDQLAAFRRKHIGIVFQNFHLIPTMTAYENVSMPLELSGIAETKDRVIEILNNVGLSKRIDHYPNQLSGGEQQRVALARAFVTQPSLLFADEPTGNLDSENGKHIIELLFNMHEKYGTTLILITHDSGLAKKTSRKFLIEDGRLHEEN